MWTLIFQTLEFTVLIPGRTGCQHYLAVHRMGSISWIEGAETTGSSGSYTSWKLYRYTERSRILFCQSILYQCKPCFQDKVESEWRC